MGQTTAIEWTDHTFNTHIGCQVWSPGCTECYAREYAQRFFPKESLWGPPGGTDQQERAITRHVTSDAKWREPLAWDRAAQADGVRRRVFCASLGDIFEDHPTVNGLRPRLYDLIRATPHLDWQLLTKRANNLARFRPADGWPSNVWLGASVENQRYADERIPLLFAENVSVRFLSCEPLLGPVDLTSYLVFLGQYEKAEWNLRYYGRSQPLSWVIVGGLSGPNWQTAPMQQEWAESLYHQCQAAGVAFFGKQASARKSGAPLLIDGEVRHAWPVAAKPQAVAS